MKENQNENKYKTNNKCKKLFCYFVYFFITHILILSFFYEFWNNFKLYIKIILIIFFYFGHLIFLKLSFSNPGIIQTNLKDSFHYSESNKNIDESYSNVSSTFPEIRSNKRAKTEISKNYSQDNEKTNINSIKNFTPTKDNNNTKKIIYTSIANEIKKSHLFNETKKNNIKINNIKEREIKNNNKENSNLNHHLEKKSSNLEFKIEDEQKIEIKDIKLENKEIILNFCNECYIEMPLRSYHCKECGYCIATFDHHCQWVNNCIGEKNKVCFHIFIIYHSIYCLFGTLYDLLNYKKTNFYLKDFLKENWIIFINNIFCLLFFSFLFSLVTFQFQIILVGQTTYENYAWHKLNYMLKLSGTQKSPFNFGIKNNLSLVYCRKKWIKNDENNDFNDILDWKKILYKFNS